jgi:hypothetical protein
MTDIMAAEFGIRQLHSRYADAVWRQDLDEFGDCFSLQCEWRISGRVFHGRADIISFMRQVFPLFRRILLTMRTPIVNIDEGIVRARTYFSEQSVRINGDPLLAIGTYFEHFVDEGDRWRFSWRLFQSEYAGAPDMSDPIYQNPEWGAPPAMPPLHSVPMDHSGII